ncbi:hypothetical protein [Streptomyces longwoodensis]|uniref:hypothetical protein n=1 Tax=Streptomyces longwoodensis TaxID=68231 RepID=UPI0033F5E4D5
MDQGEAAVWAATISAVSTALAGLGGYLAGRAQGKATVNGVKLQLSGQREDAVWQAEVDAVAALVDRLNAARMQTGRTVALLDADRRSIIHLERLGYGTREDAFASLTRHATACAEAETALRLRTAPAHADAAREVRESLTRVVDAVGAWAAVRTGGQGDATALRAEVDERMDVFRSTLDRFVSESQARFARARALQG